MKILLSFAVALLCAPVLCAATPANGAIPAQNVSAATPDAELGVVRDRFVRSVLPAGEVAIAEVRSEAAKNAATLAADGSWADINYTDTARSVWVNANHLDRMLVMAKAARLARNGGQPDAQLEGKILLALKWWTDHDYKNSNWWWNEIGVPQMMGEIASLLGPQLPGDAKAKVVTIMKRSDWHKWTGANLTWGVGIQIVRACLENDPAPVAEGFTRMYEEIRIMPQTGDGLMQDDSFHQHGTQLYNGGYGLDFANDVGRYVSFSWGTPFQIPADKMELFSSFLLDGQQWMIRGTTFDYSAVGREITRAGKTAVPEDKTAGPIYPPVGAAYGLGNVIALLAAEPTPRQKELQAFADRLQGKSGVTELSGNKQFWCSDFMTQRRAGYYASVRMMSTRMLNSELVNSEGKKSVHMTDGVNYLYLTGGEYRNIFAVWDWTKLPGTTAIQGTLETGEANPIHLLGKTTFDGGVSDGTYGMAAQDLQRGKLSAKKAWFFFDQSYVALGAGITLAGDADHDVATDVNQPLLHGDVLTSEAKGPVTGTVRYESAKPVWVYHNHVGYIVAAKTKVSLSAGPQTGKWSDIGTGSSEPVTLPVFNLWIEHGTAPQGAGYEYTVAPGATVEQVAKLANKPDVEVLANTEATQAVYNKTLKLAEIAFRQAGTLATPLGPVAADHSCLLLVHQTAAGLKVTASNPENQPLTLHVTVKGQQYAADLPGGNLAGSSVTALPVPVVAN